ncbi:MAG: amino acid adenylation domain-containing protein [Deltaproteobacteria bacterium]|nr:amino acid adenylation domain-containing protein [Deltaproteobacteria bacterium]
MHIARENQTVDKGPQLLNEEQAQRILVEWTSTHDEYDRTKTVWDAIEHQARQNPRQTAIVDGDTQVTYSHLVKRANAVAGELAARGVEPGSLVGVCMSRTWELVATLVGVLRAGCAYVPLDPEYPRERLRYILEHARVACAIVDDDARARLCAQAPARIKLDEVGDQTADSVARPSATDLAYVIYTSGSTGQPKGVAVEHRSVVAMVRSMRRLLDDEELAGVLAATSICFDISVMEIFGTLSLGGMVVLADSVLELRELSSARRIKTCICVPSAIQAALTAGGLPDGIRCLVLGAEVLRRSLVDALHALEPRPRVVNAYGPTEATVYATATDVPLDVERVTIGKPVPNARAYILDEAMHPVAVGEPGQLHLAGDQLARGYLHDEELTRQRFIEMDSGGLIAEERLYKTGDMCRWTEVGEIEFLGRTDQQVKLRGFRIELEEIESAMESMANVDGAAAAVVGEEQPMLVGYLVSRDDAVTSAAVREYLAQRLPQYMVPQIVVHLDALPRLPNGKLDRKQLSRLEAPPPRGPGSAASHTCDTGGLTGRLAALPSEQRRAAMVPIVRGEVASILRTSNADDLPLDRSLQQLGIDSLTALELGARIAAVTGRELPADVAIGPLSLAALVDHVLASFGPPTPGMSAGGSPRPLSDTLTAFQAQIGGCHPPFFAAKAAAWSVTDKGILVQRLKRLCPPGQDPYGKLVRTGSGHRGVVADARTNEERESIIWTTNLYLGLNRDPDIIKEAGDALERFGTGMGTSAAASGVTDLHLEFERAFAELVGKPAACLFPTGYTANLGAIAGLLGDNDVIVMDKLCHASIVDGARLCGAKIRTFQHNSPSDLESVLRTETSPYRTVLVVLEGVYSMGEGAAPIESIVQVAKKYDALVLVDEAHSFGFYGPRGGGLCAERGVTGRVDFIMTTLSKALGSIGGVVAGGEEHIALMKSSARAYIFQASTSPADIAAALAALRRLSTDEALRERLWENTRYMRKRFCEAGYDLGTGDGPIVTPHFRDKDKLFALVEGLYARGVHTTPVTYPIVERGRGRLRFICSAAHTRQEIDRTLEALIEAEREVEAMRAVEVEASEVAVGRAEVNEWADAFAAYVKEAQAGLSGPVPSLTVSIGLPDGGEPIEIVVNEPGIELGDPLPRCSLLLADSQTISSVCSCDVQGLLHSVVRGTCVLEGQVEGFIWLIARMAAWESDAIV